MKKDDAALRQVVDACFKDLSRDEELAKFLETLHAAYRRDPSTALPAFQAIDAIAAHEWGREDGLERDPTARMEVPWWVVQALAIGSKRYAEARAAGRTTSLGEAYGLEGGGQGKKARVTQSATELRDMRLAMGIALRVQKGMTVSTAIEEVLAETGVKLSVKRVEEIWAMHGPQARAIRYE